MPHSQLTARVIKRPDLAAPPRCHPDRRIALGRRLLLGAGLLGCLAAGGCSSLGVQPWERDLLAQPAMQLVASPMDAAADDHTYFSKEAATGGRGFGGGGCGCN
ncbi:MAG: DUF4266 domain-containing protein [Burkholderiales bacterium]|nr:DUF4266 domain-containing protein [Burkholderiales bacterium]